MTQHRLKTLQLVSVRWWNASAYYAVSLAEALNQAGHHSIVAGRGGSPPLRKAREMALPRFTDINLESLSPRLALHNLGKLRELVRREAIPLINAHRPEDGLFAALARRLSPRPLPVIRTVSDVRPPKNRPFNKYLHQKGLDYFIFSCKASYERYQAVWPVFADRSAVIYSAIDTGQFRPLPRRPALRRERGVGEEEVLIGMVARLSPVKDHHTFLRAAALVAEKAPRARFLISGEACQISHQDLRRTAAELGILDRVILLPRRDDIDVRDIIGSLDVGVVASNGSEVICRIAVEYMALGKPQVTTDINVLPEIIEPGENGFVVPARQPGAMAGQLLRLVENSDLRQRMGETARRHAEQRFSYPVLVEQTLAVYRRALQETEPDKQPHHS